MPITRSPLQFRFIPGLLLAVGLASTAPRAVAAPLFAALFLSFDTGDNPSSVAIGDLNADGRPDLAVANLEHLTECVHGGTQGGTTGRRTRRSDDGQADSG